MLPSGVEQEDYLITLVLNVYDGLNCFKTVVDRSVSVRQVDDISAQNVSEAYRRSIETGEGDDTYLKQQLALTTSVINMAASCKDAPDCVSLNRMSCSNVDDTCGLCLDGFVGEE